ncbi:MAG: hypothetical protein EPN79_16055 [Burkholderiaceae bacterium]|nr:MAG: hypothetical protein EPN79_16055 [Burkholderiaceae bacterium]
MKYGYYIDLNERGAFEADVRDEAGRTVYEVRAGTSLGEDESSLVDDGFMRHLQDLDGLATYLKSMGVLPEDADLMPMAEFEEALNDREEPDHAPGSTP